MGSRGVEVQPVLLISQDGALGNAVISLKRGHDNSFCGVHIVLQDLRCEVIDRLMGFMGMLSSGWQLGSGFGSVWALLV